MLNNIGGARAQLQQGCLDPAINKRRREIGDEIMEAQTQRATLEHRRNFLTNELARLQPQIEDHETRKRRVGRMGDPILTYVPGDYNAKEHAAVKRSFEQCQAELPNVEVTLLTIGPKMEALRAEEARLVAKAEASPL
jgi:hypothetical protein